MEDKIYIDSYTGDKSIPLFISFIIEQYKNHKGISGLDATDILDQAGVLKHFEEYYDVLHTQGAQWLLAEIDEMVERYNASK